MRTGWFSCRSACYLAAGKPVVVQDTGFSHVIPCGEGVMAFDDLDSAVRAIDAVEANYDNYCEAAREMAETYFVSDVVLQRMMSDLGIG